MKFCSQCGAKMDITLRSLVYRKKVHILNVPIYVCNDGLCAFTSVVDVIKDDVKLLMKELGDKPEAQEILFDEISEFANLLVNIVEQGDSEQVIEKMEERIDELLDLYLLAKSLDDAKWIDEIKRRLTQIKLEV
ncbi:hypothetical protein [Brevibacillus daliensis]|uniref:hypothetical protein n=1 Tax=Brevibacillus daliensis TaxID=2892995 RepID=UPI001E5512C9|nr:hypothetical protein [Brevibacillus daliensis]